MTRIPDPLLRAAGAGDPFDLEIVTKAIDYREKMIDVIRDEIVALRRSRSRLLDARRRAQLNGVQETPIEKHPAMAGGG